MIDHRDHRPVPDRAPEAGEATRHLGDVPVLRGADHLPVRYLLLQRLEIRRQLFRFSRCLAEYTYRRCADSQSLQRRADRNNIAYPRIHDRRYCFHGFRWKSRGEYRRLRKKQA